MQTAPLRPQQHSVLLLPKVTNDKSDARLTLVSLPILLACAESTNEVSGRAAFEWYVKMCEIQETAKLHFNLSTTRPGT
jgi:hypothetical protein